MKASHARGAIGFAEKILELLDEGRYTATYKYAVLLALIDLCLEGTERSGAAPDMITTHQLALKVVEIYWPHTLPFARQAAVHILQQNARRQAEIVSLVRRFRERHAQDPSLPLWSSRLAAPAPYERLVRDVEWKLIEMPLPRLQIIGRSRHEFIYRMHWDPHIRHRDVRAYLAGGSSEFDNRLLLQPGVGEYFVQLNGLLRPLIQRRWAAMVALMNGLEESRLEEFLFGASRVPSAAVRAGLWEMQQRRCFYCDQRIASPATAQVDHFVPWSRYPDDSLDNFVVADVRCNGAKASSLAAAEHLVKWARRLAPGSGEHTELASIAARANWNRLPARSHGVASAIYRRLPGDARLWLRGKEFVTPDPFLIDTALKVAPATRRAATD